MIELREVTRRYGTVVAVDRVSLTVPAGGALAVVGPSGSGKTTLLRMIAGLEPPDAGEVHIAGAPASRPGRILLPPHRRDLAMVFQRPALWPHLTVADNVAFGLTGPRAEIARRIDELLVTVGLAGLGHRRPHELSGGQAQRVALARALAPRPAVLLLDEPFANLDEDLAAELLEVVAAVRDGGATLVHVSHDRRAAGRLCTAAVELVAGRVVATPRAADLAVPRPPPAVSS